MPSSCQIQCLPPVWCSPPGPLLYSVGRCCLLFLFLGAHEIVRKLLLLPVSLPPQKKDGSQHPTSQMEAPQHRSIFKPRPLDLGPVSAGWVLPLASSQGLGLAFYLQPLPETTLGLSPHRARGGPIISDLPEDSPSPEGHRLSPSSGSRR